MGQTVPDRLHELCFAARLHVVSALSMDRQPWQPALGEGEGHPELLAAAPLLPRSEASLTLLSRADILQQLPLPIFQLSSRETSVV